MRRILLYIKVVSDYAIAPNRTPQRFLILSDLPVQAAL